MGANTKHAYRFVYLKSDKWQNVRLEALVKADGKCRIFGEESIHNDAHHRYYPESFWDTTPDHLIILYRPCHNITHAFIKNTSRNESESGAEWGRLINALKTWRNERLEWLDSNGGEFSPLALKTAYEKSKTRTEVLGSLIAFKASKKPDTFGEFAYINGLSFAPKAKVKQFPKCYLCHDHGELRTIKWDVICPGEKGPQNTFCNLCAERFESRVKGVTEKGPLMKSFRKWLIDYKDAYETQRLANSEKIKAIVIEQSYVLDFII